MVRDEDGLDPEVLGLERPQENQEARSVEQHRQLRDQHDREVPMDTDFLPSKKEPSQITHRLSLDDIEFQSQSFNDSPQSEDSLQDGSTVRVSLTPDQEGAEVEDVLFDEKQKARLALSDPPENTQRISSEMIL